MLARTGPVLSTGGGPLALLARCFAGPRRPLGDGRQYMPWISLDDEVPRAVGDLNDVSGLLT